MTSMTTPQPDADAKEALFLAARKLFAAHGPEGVSVRAIAAAAGVHFGLIRYHYGDKQGLFRTCLRRYGERRLACSNALLTPAADRTDFSEKLLSAISDLFDTQLQDPYLTRIFLQAVETADASADDVLSETVIVMARRFIAWLRNAQVRGLIRPEIDVQVITHVIQGTVNHFVRTDAVRNRHFGVSIHDPDSRQSLITTLHAMLLDGVVSHTFAKELQP
jgi:AcrR family transcriptional regulator